MLWYSEVYTDLIFFSICTILLKLRVTNNIDPDAETNDGGFFVTCLSDKFYSNKEDLPNWRQNSANKRFVINYLQQSGISVDKVTQF